MGAGVGVGFAAKSEWDDSSTECQENYCSDEGLDIRDSARGLGTVGTVLFVAGAVALAGGVVIWLTEPSASGDESATPPAQAGRPQVRVGLSLGGLSAQARW